MKWFALVIVCLIASPAIFAQKIASDSFSSVVIRKDPRLDLLVRKNAEINEENYLNSRRSMSGFRVQVLNTNDRNKAISVKSQLLQEFPAEKVYLTYQSPYFRIQMGNFRTRQDAEALRKQVNRLYDSGVFIVPSRIEVKPVKDGEIEL